jgi:hypothetical protein
MSSQADITPAGLASSRTLSTVLPAELRDQPLLHTHRPGKREMLQNDTRTGGYNNRESAAEPAASRCQAARGRRMGQSPMWTAPGQSCGGCEFCLPHA